MLQKKRFVLLNYCFSLEKNWSKCNITIIIWLYVFFFVFSIPCITIQLSQFEKTNAQNIINLSKPTGYVMHQQV